VIRESHFLQSNVNRLGRQFNRLTCGVAAQWRVCVIIGGQPHPGI